MNTSSLLGYKLEEGTSKQIIAYQNKLSGPLRDRFDINLSLMPVHLKSKQGGIDESSSSIRNRVEEAMKRQYERYEREICNSRVSYDILMKTSPLSRDEYRTLQQFSNKKTWSNRTKLK